MRSRSSGALVLATLTIVAALTVVPRTPAAAAGAPGGIDPTFAGDGTFDGAARHHDDQGRFFTISSDSGQSTVRRFATNGAPDPSFAVTTVPWVDDLKPGQLEVVADGGILLRDRRPLDGLAAFWRLGADGGLDAGYGTGGFVAMDIEDELAVELSAMEIDVGRDGSAFVVAQVGTAVSVRRFGPDGSVPAGFGQDGWVRLSCCGAPSDPPIEDYDLDALLPRPDGGLVVLADPPGDSDADPYAIAVSPTGALSQAARIGGGNRSVLGYQLDPQGRLLTWGTHGSEAFFDRWGLDLVQEATFAPDPAVAPRSNGLGKLVFGPDGSIAYTNGYELVSLTANGLPSPGFGVQGRVRLTPLDESWTGGMIAANPDGGFVASLQRHVCYGVFGSMDCGYAIRFVQVRDDGSIVSSVTYASAEKPGGWGEAWVVDGGDAALVCRCSQGAWIERRPLERASQPPGVPGAPGTPTVAVAGGTATVGWPPAATEPSAAGTESVVEVTDAVSGEVVALDEGPVAGPRFLAAVPAGRLLQVRVRTTNRIGDGPWSATSAPFVAPFTSLTAFGSQLLRDFRTGKEPVGSPATVVAPLVAKTTTAAALVAEGPLRTGFAKVADPVTRLYQATFLRPADTSGLRHWIARRRAGVTVASIASEFSRSNEFRTRYGSLGTKAFVDRVYRNVLGRPADAGGLSYWSGRIDRGVTSRGQFLASMSESGEHQRKTAAQVATTNLYAALLDRAPTAAQLHQALIPPWRDPEALAVKLMASVEYRNRIQP